MVKLMQPQIKNSIFAIIFFEPLSPQVEEFVERHQKVIVLEINRDGQMYGILRKELPIALVPKVHSVAYSDGIPPRAEIYAEEIMKVLKEV